MVQVSNDSNVTVAMALTVALTVAVAVASTVAAHTQPISYLFGLDSLSDGFESLVDLDGVPAALQVRQLAVAQGCRVGGGWWMRWVRWVGMG